LRSSPSASPEVATRRPLVAIVGNPNAGKTTLFNSLTGSRQKVGNYPGVTVEKVVGDLKLGDRTVDCVDVPGLYSLKAQSEDERVAAEVLLATGPSRPDLVVYVLDVTNLERNLFLLTQILERGLPTIVAATMTDRLESKGKQLELELLAKRLDVEVVSLVGHRDKGIDQLRDAIDRNLREPRRSEAEFGLNPAIEGQVDKLRERLARAGVDAERSEVRRDLIEPTPEFAKYLDDFPEVREAFDAARAELTEQDLLRPSIDVQARYRWASEVQRAAITDTGKAAAKRSLSDRMDLILTHRVFGLAIFVGVMYLVFQSIYTFATPLMDWIDEGFTLLKGAVSPALAGNELIQSLVVDGLITGVGSALVFLPQILILFFFIAFLEGTGYLARAAFLMDRLLGWAGLNGRAFIPLLSSFACAIPGVMAARVMPDPKSRLATILVAPLMSCSARLPVYILLIGAFVEPLYGPGWAGFSLFAMHFLGLLVAIPIVFVLNRKVLKGRRLPFVLELPPYQWPKWRDVWLAMATRGKVFVHTAGTIIVVMSIVIWAASTFPRISEDQATQIESSVPVDLEEREAVVEKRLAEEQLAQSALGRFGKAIEPAFIPAGFDWRITTAILSAFPARETVVPSLGIIFSLGGDIDEKSTDLRTVLKNATWPDGRPLFTIWTAAGLMVFFALCAQCMATLAAVKRETNSWKWPTFMFFYMTALAYLGAVLVNQIGLRLN